MKTDTIFASSFSASKYINENYIHSKFPLGYPKFNQVIRAKRELTADHSLEELGSIKNNMNAQAESFKQFSIFLTVMIFFMTTLISLVSLSLNQYSKPLDAAIKQSEARLEIVTAAMDQDTKDNLKNEFFNKITTTLKNMADSINNTLLFIFIIAAAVIIPLAFYFIWRSQWLAALNNLVESAYKEKESVQKYANRRKVKSGC